MKLSKPAIIIISISLVLAAAIPAVVFTVLKPTPPIVVFVSPTQGDICSEIFNIEVTIEDFETQNGEQYSFEIYINDELKANNYTFEWNTTEYEDGFHSITAKAYKKATNKGESSIQVTVDNYINPPPSDIFRILNYNIKESGIYPEWRRIVKEKNPDIALFVETGLWDDNSFEKHHQYLKEFNGFFYDEGPYEGYTLGKTTWSTTGETLFSRYPILEKEQIDILHLDDDSQEGLTHDMLHAVIDFYGKEVHILGVHLKAGYGEFERNKRDTEQEAIINYMDEVVGDVPLIYIGDLNSNSPADIGALEGDQSENFGDGPIKMLLFPEDPEYGSHSSSVHNFTDVFRTLNPTEPGFTYHTPAILSRIDFILVNQYFEDALINSTTGGSAYDEVASDHYCVDAFMSIADINTTLLPSKIEIEDKTNINFNKSTLKINSIVEKPILELFVISISPKILFINNFRGFFLLSLS